MKRISPAPFIYEIGDSDTDRLRQRIEELVKEVEERKAKYRESAEKAIGAQTLADKRKEYLRNEVAKTKGRGSKGRN